MNNYPFDANKDPARTMFVQRMKRPLPPVKLAGHEMPPDLFSFGGGLVHGGFTKEAAAAIHQLWTWDYMGASEFEHGAVVLALGHLVDRAKRHELVALQIPVNYSDLPKPCRWRAEAPPPHEVADVQIICPNAPAGHADKVVNAVRAMFRGQQRLSERLEAEDCLWFANERAVCGWLALDPPFLFFADQIMWESARQALGMP